MPLLKRKLKPILKRLLHNLTCPNGYYITKYGDNEMYLECLKCNYRTEGWNIYESVETDDRNDNFNSISSNHNTVI